MTSRRGWRCPYNGYPPEASVADFAFADFVLSAFAFAAFASAAAARPSGLASELPEDFAEATAAPQFSERSTSFCADALVFSGAASVLLCWFVTMQSDRSTLSPTVVDTTTDEPEPSEDLASLYFCPMTFGDEAACATPLPKVVTANPTAVIPIDNASRQDPVRPELVCVSFDSMHRRCL
jgi:hypothetical protein